MPNTTRLSIENITLSVCPVRKLFTRAWSFMRCSRSPVSFVSKNDMGSRSSLMKKSLTSDMFTRMLMCSSSQRRIKSSAVRLSVSMSCPRSTSHTNPMSRLFIPTSTMACVRNGSTSCSTQPKSSPAIICPKYFLYFFMYPNRKRNERLSPWLLPRLLS